MDAYYPGLFKNEFYAVFCNSIAGSKPDFPACVTDPF